MSGIGAARGSVLLDRGLIAWSVLLAVASGLVFGLVSAIIPNPVFARSVAPEPVQVWIWLLSAPVMGLVLATYVVRPPTATGAPLPLTAATGALDGSATASAALDRRTSRLGGIAGFGAFLAIGCPVCNKIALLLLGASGAMTFWAPLQPVVGAASLALLVATAVWRLRMRASGGACPT